MRLLFTSRTVRLRVLGIQVAVLIYLSLVAFSLLNYCSHCAVTLPSSLLDKSHMGSAATNLCELNFHEMGRYLASLFNRYLAEWSGILLMSSLIGTWQNGQESCWCHLYLIGTWQSGQESCLWHLDVCPVWWLTCGLQPEGERIAPLRFLSCHKRQFGGLFQLVLVAKLIKISLLKFSQLLESWVKFSLWKILKPFATCWSSQMIVFMTALTCAEVGCVGPQGTDIAGCCNITRHRYSTLL